MPIKILLADDHAIVRHGLLQSLQKEKDMQVIGQAENGISTVEMVRELLPDVVIMDISMPDLNGMEATRQIVRDFSGVKVIALSMHSAKKFITEMFKAGAAAYLLKNSSFEELAEAIRTVMSGKSYISPEISSGIIENYIKTADQKQPSVFSTLSKREREVLQLLAEGQTTKQIGLKLHISPKTVEAHRLRIMDKLDIDNIAQLTKYAIQEGLTSAEP